MRVCPQCGTEFEGHGKRKYCSGACYHVSTRGRKHSIQSREKHSATLREGYRSGRLKRGGLRVPRVLRSCACGCEETFVVKENDPRRYVSKYHYYHDTNKPKRRPQKPWKLTEEAKRLRAERIKANPNWVRASFKKGHTPSLWQHTASPEKLERWRERIVVGMRELYADEKRGPEVRQKIRAARMRQVFPRLTDIEAMLREGLLGLGLSEVPKGFATAFQPTEFAMKPSIGYHEPDAAIPASMIAIYTDGCYYHNCPHCYPDGGISLLDKRGKSRDKQANSYLQNRGWTVLRFWGHEMRKEFVRCMNLIKKAMGG